jgi:GNAT superfamily N-acetyltransferase
LRPAHLAQRTREVLREGGPRAFFWHLLAVAGVRRLNFYCADIEARFPPRLAVPGVAVRGMGPDDGDAYRGLRPDAPPDEAERRLRNGDRCLTAWRGDRMVAAYWLAIREAPVPYLGISIPLADGAWYAYDAFVAPEERNRGLHNLLRNEAVPLARREGASAIVYSMLQENRAALRLLGRFSRPLGTVLTIRIGRRRLIRSEVPRKYLGRPHRAT